MKYKVIKKQEEIKNVFDELRKSTLVKGAYFGKTILNVCGNNFGIIYDQERGEIITMGKENKGLLKKFNELPLSKGVVLEAIN